MSYLINQITEMLGCLAGHMHNDNTFIYPTADRIKLYKLQVNLLELLFPEGDYQYSAQYGENACQLLTILYLKEKDFENAWFWLEKYADFAIHFDTYDFETVHTSPVLKGYSDGGWIMEASGNDSNQLLNWLLNDTITEPFRSDIRFDNIIKHLKHFAKKQ